MLDGFADVPDQLGDQAALPVLAVDLQRNLRLRYCTGDCRGGDRADRCGVVERLADTPRAALFFHVVLQVAPRHVQPHCITEDVFAGIGSQDVPATGADGHHQLDFMVQVPGQAGVGNGGGFSGWNHHHRVGRLEEEKWWLAAGESHLLGVLLVVAPDTVDAVHRKPLGAAQHRNRYHWRRLKYETHGNSVSVSRTGTPGAGRGC